MENNKKQKIEEQENSAQIQAALGNDTKQIKDNEPIPAKSVPKTTGTGSNQEIFNTQTIKGDEETGTLEVKKESDGTD